MKRTINLLVLITLLALTFGSLGRGSVRAAVPSSLWTWVDGSTTVNQLGTYGTEDVASATNVPGARYQSVSWIDGAGNLWLFGGRGYASSGPEQNLNDLWMFDPATGEWTWVDGSSSTNEWGTYGTEDVADAANVPGARFGSSSWKDSAGNFWLFGGYGFDSAGNVGLLNDLWMFDPTTGEWTWVDGPDLTDQNGVYGTEDISDAANVPGARIGSASWIDSAGNLWLFGGDGFPAFGLEGRLNDLWKFDPVTGEWTWVDGHTATGAWGVYGTEDVAAAANAPGGRAFTAFWLDGSDRLWVFGGTAFDGGGDLQEMNDLWMFDPATGWWTWVDGPDGSLLADLNAVYGTEDMPAAANIPGARKSSTSWTDSTGKFWLFGGWGHDTGPGGNLNDLWVFDPATGWWTWVDGASSSGQSGIYGTEDVPDSANAPGGRIVPVSWIDSADNLWLFGGNGNDSVGTGDTENDLWMFGAILNPGAFNKTSPANGATGVSTSPTLSWGASSGQDDYEYCIDPNLNSACDSGGAWTSTSNATSVALSGLAYNNSYEWQVRAVNGSGNTEADGGTWWTFVTEADTTPPVVTVPSDITAEATSASGAVVNFVTSATDTVSPANPSVTCSPSSGTTFPLGLTPVDCWAADDANNIGHGYFNVTVVDTTAPTLNLPANITVPQTIPAGAVVSFVVTASDVVDASPTVACVPPSGSVFPVGTTTVNCSATDDYSNTSNGSFTVTVTAAPGGNLIKKPDFASASVFPSPWQAFGFKPPYAAALDCNFFNFGSCSVLFPAGNRSAMQRVVRSGAAGDTYSFGMYSAANNAPAGGKYLVEVAFYNNYNKQVGISQLNFSLGTHGFELVSGPAVATGNYNKITFRFYYHNPSGRAWFDDAFLYALP